MVREVNNSSFWCILRCFRGTLCGISILIWLTTLGLKRGYGEIRAVKCRGTPTPSSSEKVQCNLKIHQSSSTPEKFGEVMSVLKMWWPYIQITLYILVFGFVSLSYVFFDIFEKFHIFENPQMKIFWWKIRKFQILEKIEDQKFQCILNFAAIYTCSLELKEFQLIF